MRRYVKWLVLGGVAVLLAGGFLVYYFAGYETTDDAQVDVHLSSISARIDGHVVNVHVGDNEYVQEGAVLVELDPADYQVAVDKARADLANSEATAQSLSLGIPVTSVSTSSQLASSASDVQSAEAGIVAAQHEVAAAHAQVQEAEANDVRTQADVSRYGLLVEKQEVSAQVYAQAVAAGRASSAAVAGARANQAATEQAVAQAIGAPHTGRSEPPGRADSPPAGRIHASPRACGGSRRPAEAHRPRAGAAEPPLHPDRGADERSGEQERGGRDERAAWPAAAHHRAAR